MRMLCFKVCHNLAYITLGVVYFTARMTPLLYVIIHTTRESHSKVSTGLIKTRINAKT